jgi:hypothetical protein
LPLPQLRLLLLKLLDLLFLLPLPPRRVELRLVVPTHAAADE